jgi:hypothetical protein
MNNTNHETPLYAISLSPLTPPRPIDLPQYLILKHPEPMFLTLRDLVLLTKEKESFGSGYFNLCILDKKPEDQRF